MAQVTVIIPVFNAGPLLREAVDSILRQTFPDFKLIILNDGSTDGCLEFLNELNDSRIDLIDNKNNVGLIKILNQGLDLVTTPLVARMDADDVAHPDRLKRQVAAFQEVPDLALLGTCAVMIDERGVAFQEMDVPQTHEDIIGAIFQYNPFIHPSVMMRTSVVRSLGGYPANAPYAEDYALWLRLCLRYKTANLPDRLMKYRVHPEQVSQRKIAMQRHTVQQIQREAWHIYHDVGLVKGDAPPSKPRLWARIRGHPGTLGADYLWWARVYRRMGNNSGTKRSVLLGLLSAPLAHELLGAWWPAHLLPSIWFNKLRSSIRDIKFRRR